MKGFEEEEEEEEGIQNVLAFSVHVFRDIYVYKSCHAAAARKEKLKGFLPMKYIGKNSDCGQ